MPGFDHEKPHELAVEKREGRPVRSRNAGGTLELGLVPQPHDLPALGVSVDTLVRLA
jgi:hypothetical protein